MSKIDKELVTKRVAIHEGGHCLMAYLLGYPIEEVTVFVNEYHYDGWVNIDPDPNGRIVAQTIEEHGLIRCAGNAAEFVCGGRRHWAHYSSDYIDTVNSLSWLYGCNDEIEACINFLWLRAKNILSEPANQYALEYLADCIQEWRQEPGYWDDDGIYHINDDFENTWQLDGYRVYDIIAKSLEWYEKYGQIPRKKLVWREP